MKAAKNPFRSAAIAKICYRMNAVQRSHLIARFQQQGWLGSIVGLAGTGKTTLLEDLEPAVRHAGREVVWVRLNAGSSKQACHAAVEQIMGTQPNQCCFLDGGEVLGRLNWWKLAWRKKTLQGGVLATLHTRRFLPVTHTTQPDIETCVELARSLAGHFWDAELARTARQAFYEQSGNVREVFRACYHACALRDG